MRLAQLLEEIVGEMLFEGEWDREISMLSMRSDEEMKNALFFCLEGEVSDGHLYASEAVRKGAVAVVTERKLALNVPQFLTKSTRVALAKISSKFHGKPSEQLKIIGITGTNGKTTTAYMLSSILKESGKNVGVIGTLGVRYGEKYYPSNLTTPDPIELHRIFLDMRICGVTHVVMEVSAHSLYYQKVAGIAFCACIFTNLSQDHLDFFSDMESYGRAKADLFTQSVCPIAILNGDEKMGRILGKEREEWEGKTMYYGLDTPSDAFAIVTKEALEGSTAIFNINDKLCRVRVSMVGIHNIYNALAASTCAYALGVSIHDIARGLTDFSGVDGRLEHVCSYKGADIFVDFAHTPDALQKSLNSLRPHTKGRLICLFGCGGNRDKSKRPLMGEVVAKNTDFSILTSDNPRYEDPLDIISDIEKGYRRFSVRYVIVPDRAKGIEYGMDFLKEGDVLLIAGKGGEKTQEIMGIKYPFVDQDIVKNYLEKNGK
jgi:UDP-N-acetylmuramyl-tripeptide synthetase